VRSYLSERITPREANNHTFKTPSTHQCWPVMFTHFLKPYCILQTFLLPFEHLPRHFRIEWTTWYILFMHHVTLRNMQMFKWKQKRGIGKTRNGEIGNGKREMRKWVISNRRAWIVEWRSGDCSIRIYSTNSWIVV